MKYIVFFLVIFLSSCENVQKIEEINDCVLHSNPNNQLASLKSHRDFFECLDFERYEFVDQKLSQTCVGNFVVTIADSEITETILLNNEPAVEDFCEFFTIPELFSILNEALDLYVKIETTTLLVSNGIVEESRVNLFVADEVTVEYDPEFGHPTFINIDYISGLADEEFSSRITNFKVLD